jgi:hypothetical protein
VQSGRFTGGCWCASLVADELQQWCLVLIGDSSCAVDARDVAPARGGMRAEGIA